MALQVEIWRQDIVENLFPNNQFSAYATSHDMHVVEGAIVHIPKAGARPTVVRNRASVPATVGTRTDVDLSYTLTEYSTDPVYIKEAQKYELSYDLRMAILGEHLAALREAMHDDLLHYWLGTATGLGALPAGNVIQTTGTLTSGKRLITTNDIIALKNAMDKANIPDEGRYLLLPPDLYNQLFTSADMINAEIMGRHNLPAGIITQVLGFNVLKRSYTPVYDNALAIKAKGAAPVATDRQSAVAWSRFAVSRALGQVELFEDLGSPTYYGDVYSTLVRAGGIRLRNEGMYALVQANV